MESDWSDCPYTNPLGPGDVEEVTMELIDVFCILEAASQLSPLAF